MKPTSTTTKDADKDSKGLNCEVDLGSALQCPPHAFESQVGLLGKRFILPNRSISHIF